MERIDRANAWKQKTIKQNRKIRRQCAGCHRWFVTEAEGKEVMCPKCKGE